jgi:hypothetical protein
MSRADRAGRHLRRVAGAFLAVAVTVGVAAFGRLPTTLNPDRRGVVRLSWRLRGSQVEQACRRPTAEELAELPAHMRNPDACVGRVAPYRLTVQVDHRTAVDRTIQGAGARHDRPIYVLQDLEVEPGIHRVHVSFRRDDPEAAGEEALELSLDRSLEVGARRVVLVTYDADRRRLVVRRETP